MSDVLLDLVSCDALRGKFPRGVPRRACLRRQLERKRVGKDWAPAHPGCVGCELGRQVRAEVEAAGVLLGTCDRHGSAIVSRTYTCEACEVDDAPRLQGSRRPCPECKSVSKHAVTCSRPTRDPLTRSGVARESRPVVTLRGAPKTTLIWAGAVPDVPIAASPRHGAGLTAEDERVTAARVREALRHPTSIAALPPGAEPARRIEHPAPPAPAPTTRADTPREVHAAPPPATPDQEDTMPKGYARGMPCKTCKATGPRHKKGCAEDGKKAPPPAAGGDRSRRPRREERGVTRAVQALPGVVHLQRVSIDDLLTLRLAVETELKVRKEAAEAQVVKLRAAIGEAA